MTMLLLRVNRLGASRSSSYNYSRLLSAYKTTKYSTSSALGSSLSSFFEPDPTLFSPMEATGKDAQLRSDIRTMGSLLGKIIQEQNGVQVFNQVEAVRHLAKVHILLQLGLCLLVCLLVYVCVPLIASHFPSYSFLTAELERTWSW